jgi:ankyrin repeat protein
MEDLQGATALHHATRAVKVHSADRKSMQQREGEEEIIQTLLRFGADLHDLDIDGRTPVDFRLYYHQHQEEVREVIIMNQLTISI